MLAYDSARRLFLFFLWLLTVLKSMSNLIKGPVPGVFSDVDSLDKMKI
jgi:hypothetical protein